MNFNTQTTEKNHAIEAATTDPAPTLSTGDDVKKKVALVRDVKNHVTVASTISMAESILEHIYRAQRSCLAGLPSAEYMTLDKLLKHYSAEDRQRVIETVFSSVCVSWLNADLFQVPGCPLVIRSEHFATIGSAIYGDSYIPVPTIGNYEPKSAKVSLWERITRFLKGK